MGKLGVVCEEGVGKVIMAEEVRGTPEEREGVGAVDVAGVAAAAAAKDGRMFALILTLMTGRLL